MKIEAHFSKCMNYRYALWRTWDESKPFVMIVGLNPSKTEDNPTITRCTNFAKGWGFGGVCVTNLFAYRATEPRKMMAAAHPVGEENDAWLTRLSEKAGLVVAAWGNDGSFLNRSAHVKGLLWDIPPSVSLVVQLAISPEFNQFGAAWEHSCHVIPKSVKPPF